MEKEQIIKIQFGIANKRWHLIDQRLKNINLFLEKKLSQAEMEAYSATVKAYFVKSDRLVDLLNKKYAELLSKESQLQQNK